MGSENPDILDNDHLELPAMDGATPARRTKAAHRALELAQEEWARSGIDPHQPYAGPPGFTPPWVIRRRRWAAASVAIVLVAGIIIMAYRSKDPGPTDRTSMIGGLAEAVESGQSKEADRLIQQLLGVEQALAPPASEGSTALMLIYALPDTAYASLSLDGAPPSAFRLPGSEPIYSAAIGQWLESTARGPDALRGDPATQLARLLVEGTPLDEGQGSLVLYVSGNGAFTRLRGGRLAIDRPGGQLVIKGLAASP